MSGRLLILAGASGSGKTTIANLFRTSPASAGVEVEFFDSIGVPTDDEMVVRHGSGEEWQRAMTAKWIERLAERTRLGGQILFEGQMRFSFVRQALEHEQVNWADCWLVDCKDESRYRRLIDDRDQPELATQDMMMWARHLRKEASDHGFQRLDTDLLSPSQSVERIAAYFGAVAV